MAGTCFTSSALPEVNEITPASALQNDWTWPYTMEDRGSSAAAAIRARHDLILAAQLRLIFGTPVEIA
jgi:hypothetical protein